MAAGDATFKCFERFQTCCKPIFQVFQLFQMHVSSVLYECCKNISGCYICCSGCTLMLQAPVPMIHLFFRRMLQVFYLDIYVCLQ
jgi:hypothetical protein